MADRSNQNALSYWFPLIETAGLPVPRTVMVDMPKDVWESILSGINGEEGPSAANPAEFYARITSAGDVLGWPCFLRTDHTSNKHNWRNACFLQRPDDIPRHIWQIAEFSELAGFVVDLSWDRWAVREMLPVKHLGYCRHYGDMPVVREFRFFVTDGHVDCWHPYWPESSLEQGACEYVDVATYADVSEVDDAAPLHALAAAAGVAVGGSWSVDILDTERGWMITDMALADDSYHWEGCNEWVK